MKGFLITRAPQEERLLEHVVTGFYACIFVTSLVTNAFLFTVFLRNKHFRDLSTYLIVQMAAADVLYLCVTCSIVAIKNLDIELNHITCKVLLYVEGAARFASSLSLMLISLERSTAVCSPSLCYTIRKVARVKEKACASVSIISLILRMGVLFVACDPEKWAPGYRLAVTIATYILPLVVELIAYTIAYHKINRRISNAVHSKQVLLFVKKSLKVFVVIAVVFAVCTLPSSILVILQSLRLYTPSFFVGYLGDLIECIPCVTNVICYVFCSPKFRMEIKKLFSGESRTSAMSSNFRLITVCGAQTKESGSNVNSADGGEDEDGLPGEAKDKRANKGLILKLDWVLGDDPSQVPIPGSPTPRADIPLDIPSTVQEGPEFSLGDNLESEQAPSTRKISGKPRTGTWPRMRRLLYSGWYDSGFNTSRESFVSGSTSNGLNSGTSKSSTETLESNLPRSLPQTLTQGTQTECNMLTVLDVTVQEESSQL